MVRHSVARQTRRAGKHLRVPVLPEEAAAICAKAQSCGLSTASYLRNLGLGFFPESLDTTQAAEVLWRLQVDLERIANLLGLCVGEASGLGPAERTRVTRTVPDALAELRALQAALLAAARRL